MKKLIEDYQTMLKRGLASFDKVLEAGGNILLDRFNLLSEDKKAEAQKRWELCMSCPFMSENIKDKGVYTTTRKEPHCSICGCIIDGKVMSFESDCAIKEYSMENIPGWKARWYKLE